MPSPSAQKLLEKLEANSKRKRGRYEIITVSSLMAMRTNLKSADKTIAAIRELQSEGLLELREIVTEGRHERELIVISPLDTPTFLPEQV
jgi:hypothetical protein